MRVLKYSGWTMVSLGALLLLFLAYQLVFTNVLTARAQDAASTALEARFETLRKTEVEGVSVVPTVPTTTVTTLPGTATPTTVTTVAPPEPVVFFPEESPELGSELGRIVIPEIEVDKVVIQGVERNHLKTGPGHMSWTPMPGQIGNAVISGHRTTYGAPFFRLDELEPGDEIMVETVVGTHTYAVQSTIVVKPTDVWVTEERPGAWLTLTTCNPRYSARQRLVVFAQLIDGPNLEYAEALKEAIREQSGTS